MQPFPIMMPGSSNLGKRDDDDRLRTFILTPQQSQEVMARRMRDLGDSDARAGGPGADGGIDIRSSKSLDGVKFTGGFTGRPDLQRLFGARGDDRKKQLWFFAASGFTNDARTYTDEHSIFLLTYLPTGQIQPENKAAEDKLGSFRAKRAERVRARRTARLLELRSRYPAQAS